MPVGSIGKWQIEYPLHGTDWNTAVASTRDEEMAFGVELERSRGEDGAVQWRVRSLIRPSRMGNDFPQLVRNYVRMVLRDRPI